MPNKNPKGKNEGEVDESGKQFTVHIGPEFSEGYSDEKQRRDQTSPHNDEPPPSYSHVRTMVSAIFQKLEEDGTIKVPLDGTQQEVDNAYHCAFQPISEAISLDWERYCLEKYFNPDSPEDRAIVSRCGIAFYHFFNDVARSIVWQKARSPNFKSMSHILRESKPPPIPTEPPASWPEDRLPKEKAVAFFQRVYGQWLSSGLTRAHLLNLDKKLYKALATWIDRHGGELPFDLPSKKQIKEAKERKSQEASQRIVEQILEERAELDRILAEASRRRREGL